MYVLCTEDFEIFRKKHYEVLRDSLRLRLPLVVTKVQGRGIRNVLTKLSQNGGYTTEEDGWRVM